MIINPIVFFAAVLALYGICHLVRYLVEKKNNKAVIEEQPKEEKELQNV